MYYQSSSHRSSSLGEFWPNTWPKTTTIAPHSIYPTTSSEAQTWLTGAMVSASYYDRMNNNLLSKAIPEYILEDINNSTIVTLTDMIGQHYDVIWTYIKGITDLNDRDESLTTGIAKNLLWHVGTSLGMNLPNGNAGEELWKWALGTDASGSMANGGTGFASGSLPQLTSEDVTKSIWSRLINTLPYLLRTKGTTRGVKAVLACYGVPDTVIDIKEYGGPKGTEDNEKQFLQEEKASYALKFARGNRLLCKASKAVTTNETPRAFEFRFKTNEKDDQMLLERPGPSTGAAWWISLHHSGSISQTVNPLVGSSNIPLVAQTPRSEKGIFGRLTFFMTASCPDHSASIVSASTEYLPLYNGDWWNVCLQTDVTGSTSAGEDNTTHNQKWHITVKAAKDHSNGKITHSGSATLTNHTGSYSASYNHAWRYTYSSYTWGGSSAAGKASYYGSTGVRGSAGDTKMFSGSMQEIRLWGGMKDALTDNVLEQHTLSPRSYVGNNFSSSFDHLWARWPLGTEFKKSNLSGSYNGSGNQTIIESAHPDQTRRWNTATHYNATHLTASSFLNSQTESNGSHFEPIRETYYTTLPSYPSNGISSTKIRVEDSMLTKQLSAFERAELSEYDRHPIDTHTVGIHLSLQHQINRDIAYQFGDMRVDDFIGDPAHLTLPNYPDLEKLKNYYFKKLYDKPDMADFARILTYYDVSMFEMVKSMVPARCNSYVGLLVESHILERNKIQHLPNLTQSAHSYEGNLILSETQKGNAFPMSMSSEFVSEYSASLKTAGGENWFLIKADSANSSSHGQLDDTIIIGNSASYTGARYNWTQHYRNKNADGTFTVGSYEYTSEPFNTVVTGSRLSQIWETRVFKYSSSYSASWDSDRGIMAGGLGYGLSEPMAIIWNANKGLVENGLFDRQRGKAHIYPRISAVPQIAAERQDTDPAGFFNARYAGCKLQGGQYNQDSPGTHDGSPVIEIFDSNPNQLIVTNPSVLGGSLMVPGIKKYPITTKYGTQGWDNNGDPIMLINDKSAVVTNQKYTSAANNVSNKNTGNNNTYA